ncbi:MAG: type II toxin-antitoxin system RelE/ParE family toxin [Candidatus Solibacter usitatus]|nr:type II toxin-antitoxin system RelE/ParE family toxin [Candidatus Solibacter usitatus]
MTVVETMEFLQRANRLMSESDRADLVVFLASNPEAGVIVPETGGVRKMRWALPGMGKRGGARVIYYYHNQTVPIFLLSAYAKNQKANLSAADLKAMKSLVRSVVASYPRKP